MSCAAPTGAELLALGRLCSSLLGGALVSPGELESRLPAELVLRQGLGPLAYDAGFESFKMAFVENALAAEIRARVLEEVVGSLEDAGLRVCFLKGCAYVQDLYEDPALRPMTDLDLLVPPEEVEPAVASLQAMGFVARTDKPFMFAPTHHAMTFDRGGISVDLHRSMTQARRTRIRLDEVWARARLELHRLDAVDELAFHLIHMVRHELAVPLISWVDLQRLIESAPAMRQRAIERCDEFRAGRGARLALRMLDALRAGEGAGRGVPFPLPSRLELLADEPLGRRRQLLAKLTLLQGPAEVAGLAAVTLFERGRSWKR